MTTPTTNTRSLWLRQRINPLHSWATQRNNGDVFVLCDANWSSQEGVSTVNISIDVGHERGHDITITLHRSELIDMLKACES